MNTYEIRVVRKGVKSPNIHACSHISDHAAVHLAQNLATAVFPFSPLGFVATIAVEIGVGFLLLIGYRALGRLGIHGNFSSRNMIIHFSENLMIAGGLLQIVNFGAGASNAGNRQSHRAEAVMVGPVTLPARNSSQQHERQSP
jgi:uncharacterized membrane protein YphA (DoxX/SURF4 family)